MAELLAHDGYLELARRAGRAERDLVAGALRQPERLDVVAASLSPGLFRDRDMGLLWAELLAMYAANETIHPLSLAERLIRVDRLAGLGGEKGLECEFLKELWEYGQCVPDPAYSAKQVRDFGLLLELSRVGREIIRLAESPTGPAEESLHAAERLLFRVAERGCEVGVTPLEDAVDAALARIAQCVEGGRSLSGLSSGLEDLDAITSGFHPGELVILAARPGVGKTSIALAIARQVAATGGGVLFSSLEMSGEELACRLLCADSGVEGRLLRQGRVSDEQGRAIVVAGHGLRPLPFAIDDAAEQPVLRLAANARRLKRKGQLALVCVDYLQLVAPEDRRLPRHEQVAGISRRLKALARELSLPVLAMAQLNRESEQRTGQKPRLADLRESGGIEADADVVILLHREPDREELLNLIVAKNRNGPTGDAVVRFDRATMRFSDVETAVTVPW